MADKAIDEIRFADLTDNDTVVVQTANNVYTFQVRNAGQQVGMLAGGSIKGPKFVVASGTLLEDEVADDRLKVGGRALFFSSGPLNTMGFNRIVTSPIAQIRVDHGASDRRAA